MSTQQIELLVDKSNSPSISTVEKKIKVLGCLFLLTFIYDLESYRLLDSKLTSRKQDKQKPEYQQALATLFSENIVHHSWEEIREGLRPKPPIIKEHSMELAITPIEDEYTKPAINGYVYLIQSATGAYKIGRSKNPTNRMKTFGVTLPFEVEYVALIPTENSKMLEKELHKRFSNKHINGEWFALDLEDVEFIKGLEL